MRNLPISLALMPALVSIGAARQNTTNLERQIVCCEDCWNRADRKTVAYGTTEDLEKAAQCVANGDPTLLAVGRQGCLRSQSYLHAIALQG